MPNTRRTVIESLGVYLPPKSVATEEVIRRCRNPITFPFEEITGISSRRVAGEGEFAIDLARQAILECLAHSRHDAKDIELVVCGNISRCDGPRLVSFEPATSVRLKSRLGLDNAIAFDVANACAGMWTAIAIVDAYIRAGRVRCALVASGEYVTHLTETAQKELDGMADPRLACLTVGDAGAAVILEASTRPDAGLHSVSLYTLGRYSDYCIAKATDREHGGAIMLTDSLRLSSVATPQAVAHAAGVLRHASWPSDSVDHVIMHQTSRLTLRGATREINRHFGGENGWRGTTIDNLAERGNTASTTHFVALWDRIHSDEIRTGDRVVFSITASGVTIGTALYTLDDLPDRLRGRDGTSARERRHRAPRRSRPLVLPPPRVRVESVGTLEQDWAGDRETVGLAAAAVERCLASSSRGRFDLDLLVYAGVYRTDFVCEPAIASLVAGAAGINDAVDAESERKTLAFDVFNGSVGVLQACHLAGAMLSEGRDGAAMIVSAEIENNRGASPDSVVGVAETGSAILLERCPAGRGFGRFLFEYFPEHESAFRSHAAQQPGGARLQVVSERDLAGLYLACIPATARKLLALEGLDLSDVDLIVPPQISSDFVARLAGVLGAHPGQLVDATTADGAYFTSSLAYALAHISRHELAAEGDVALVVEASAGLQVACALYSF